MVEPIKELRNICQSKKQPLYMRVITMKISIYITKILLYTKISADYVTMSMMIFLIIGSILMGLGNLWMIFIGILLIHFTIILDNVNGEVARYWKEDGMIGTFLEQVYHNLAVHLIFFSVSLGVFIQTGMVTILIFGFLASIFGRPIILSSIKDAVIAERFEEIKKKIEVKLHASGKSNVKGGSTKTGGFLYRTYDKIRDFWVFPANIVHITIIAIVELINIQYGFLPSYTLFSAYIILYGTFSTFTQITAFFINYKGRTFDHYYKALFRK
jgi:phosphatidylglycerophosphate synthase